MSQQMTPSEPGWFVVKARQSDDDGLLVTASRVVGWLRDDTDSVTAVAYDASTVCTHPLGLRPRPHVHRVRRTEFVTFHPEWAEANLTFIERGEHSTARLDTQDSPRREWTMMLSAEAAAALKLDREELDAMVATRT